MHAQKQDSIKTRQLKGVDVTTARMPVNPFEIRHAQQTITETMLQNIPAKDIGDVVKHMAGANVRDYGGIGGIKTVSVRSLGAAHTSVYYDGLPVTDCNTGQTNIGRFSKEHMMYMQLYSGSPSDIFHPARQWASASTLVIQTRTPRFWGDKKMNLDASLQCGSFHSIQPFLHIENRLGEHFSSSISSEYNYSKGDYPFTYRNHTLSVSDRRENSEVENCRLEGNLFYHTLQRDAQVKIFYYRSMQQLPGAIVYYNPVCHQQMNENNFFAQIHYQNNYLGRNDHCRSPWKFQNNSKFNYSDLQYIDPDYLNAAHYLENNYRQWEYYLSNALMYEWEAFGVNLSNDLSINYMESDLPDFVPPTRFTSQTALAARYQPEKTGWTGNIALLHNYFADHNTAETTQLTQKLSPSVNIGWSSTDYRIFKWGFRGSYKNIFRMPSFSELFYRLFGTANLKPEDVQEFDMGISMQDFIVTDKLFIHFDADAFYNIVSNKIVAVPSQNLFVWTMINYGNVHITGCEAKLHAIYEPNILLEFSGDLTYTFQQALNMTDPDSKSYRQQIPYTPRHAGNAIIGCQYNNTQLSYSLLYVGERFTQGQNVEENRLAPYWDHGLSLTHSFRFFSDKKATKKPASRRVALLKIHLEAMNLADKNYEIIRNYPMPGRQFQAKISVSF
ncbi:MAG: TonB-dependent receptor plug domain-containing protein [Bacteroidales bacterium]|nr:TonB-dependent receptor plug domain-containing protein [Bacteroidales bacterium]